MDLIAKSEERQARHQIPILRELMCIWWIYVPHSADSELKSDIEKFPKQTMLAPPPELISDVSSWR